jgi:hyperosmotically inducible periplasmic protein
MKTSKRDSRLRKVFGSVVAAIVALGASTLLAQSAAARLETERVRAALEALPNYGVFDFLAFERDEGSVTLIGYAYTGTLKSDAAKALREVGGIDEIGNRIERLPASLNDDRIRWSTFYRIYTDPFLSRYAPGGAPNARYETIRYSRFPGLQPLGRYPIHIVVKHGRTTLVGAVDNEGDRMLAEVRAREISGVFEVKNELEVLSD